MKKRELSIGETAQLLGITIQTLRRWDEEGVLKALRSGEQAHRYYAVHDLERGVEAGKFDLIKMARAWAMDERGWEPVDSVYCPTSDMFKARLHRLEQQLEKTSGGIGTAYTLVTAITGEIGNNSFDHNLGSWPDISGIFFGCDVAKRIVVLADRGQGIRTTLVRVKPTLRTHADALRTAFTEILTARASEHRGNGLKYVRSIITSNALTLAFQTGDAQVRLAENDTQLDVTQETSALRGCFAVIHF